MKSAGLPEPQIVVVEGQELSLSTVALIELMQAVLAKGMPFRFRAGGFSMSPFIRDGDVISVAPLIGTRPRIGDVVAFVHPDAGKLIVHRVIGQHGDACLMQGDNLLGIRDGLIPLSSILGRVRRVERNGHDVWLGLGPERYVIAFLSRAGLLVPLRLWLAAVLRPFLRRSR